MHGNRLWWIPLPVVAIDRLCKRIALNMLSGGAVTAVPGVLSWNLTQNTGAAFSLLSGQSLFLIILTFALIAGIIVVQLRSRSLPVLMRIGLWWIVGGGAGNLWDRLSYGGVIDFIRIDFIRFPIFNPADVFVCAGAGLVILSLLIRQKGGAADA